MPPNTELKRRGRIQSSRRKIQEKLLELFGSSLADLDVTSVPQRAPTPCRSYNGNDSMEPSLDFTLAEPHDLWWDPAADIGLARSGLCKDNGPPPTPERPPTPGEEAHLSLYSECPPPTTPPDTSRNQGSADVRKSSTHLPSTAGRLPRLMDMDLTEILPCPQAPFGTIINSSFLPTHSEFNHSPIGINPKVIPTITARHKTSCSPKSQPKAKTS